MDLSLDSEKNLMKKLFAFFIFVVFINISGLLAQNVIQESGDDTTSPLMMFGFEGDRSSHSDDDDDWQPFLQNERLRDSTDGDYELAERGNSRNLQREQASNESPLEDQFALALKEKRAQKTIASLRAIDVTSGTDLSSMLWSLIIGRSHDPHESTLILNNGEPPFWQHIPATGDQQCYTSIIPAIIPVGLKMYLDNSDQASVVPSRIPTAEENQQVRSLIKEALEVHVLL